MASCNATELQTDLQRHKKAKHHHHHREANVQLDDGPGNTWIQPPPKNIAPKLRDFSVSDQKTLKEGKELKEKLMQLQKDVELLVHEKKELEKMKGQMESVKANQTAQIESSNHQIKEKEAALIKKDKELKAQ